MLKIEEEIVIEKFKLQIESFQGYLKTVRNGKCRLSIRLFFHQYHKQLENSLVFFTILFYETCTGKRNVN